MYTLGIVWDVEQNSADPDAASRGSSEAGNMRSRDLLKGAGRNIVHCWSVALVQ